MAMTPVVATVEELLAELQAMPASAAVVELWVPNDVTLRGQAAPLDVAMSVILDKALKRGLWPDGFSDMPGGRLYMYRVQKVAGLDL